MNWKEITSPEEIKSIALDSTTNPGSVYVIFKHSTRCSTSRMALRMFESDWNHPAATYLINVVENRASSNEATSLFGIVHESPQVLVIKNGECVYNASHSQIDAESVMHIAQ